MSTLTNTIPRTASVTELKSKFEEFFDYIQKTNQPLFIFKKNKPAAILLSPDYYKEISDTQFTDHETMTIKKSIDNFYQGKRSSRDKILSILK